jgi:phage-related minor tail protein
MSDEINVRVILDPSQTQAGSADVVAAIQGMSNDIVAALGKTTTASNSAAAAIRSGFAGVGDQLDVVIQRIHDVQASVVQSGQAIVTTLNQMGAAGGNAGNGMQRAGHAAAGVRRELLVLGHEALMGNWTRFGGSIMVLGERLDWLRYLTGPVGVGIGLVAAAVAAVTVAAIKGAEEINHLNNELVLTGNAAGLTTDKYLAMAHAIADANRDLTLSQSKGAVGAVAGTGMFGPDAMNAISTAVAEISRLSGETATKVAADFAKMDDGVYKWANTNKEAKNLITAADAEYARTLEEQGRKEEAEIYLAQKISERLHQVSTDLGILPGLWNDVKQAASEAWDAMMGVGRPDSLSVQIDKLKERRKNLMDTSGTGSDQLGALGGGVNLNMGDDKTKLDNQIAFLQNEQKYQEMLARNDAAQAQVNREGKEASDRLRRDNEQLKDRSILEEKIAEYHRDIEASSKNGGFVPTQEAQQKYIAYLTKLYNDHDPKQKTLGAAGAGAVDRATDNGELALIKDRLGQEEKLLNTSYKNNEITLQEYYDTRKKLVEEGMQAEIAVANRAVGNAQSAATHAGNNPNAQQEAQARIVQAKNRVALLNQQLQEQESNLTAEMQEQIDLQTRKLAQIQEQQNLAKVDANTAQQQRLGQFAVTMGMATNAQLLQLDRNLEDERYQVAMAGLQRRLQLPHQSVEQQAQINAQIEALEQQHQAKMTELNIQGATEQTQSQRQAMNDLEGDIEQLSENLAAKPQQWRQSFMQFFTSLDQQLVKLSANALFKELAGPGTSAGGTLSGIFSKMFGGASGTNAIATQQVTSSQIMTATVPSMSVANMTVANSNSLSGGSGGGGLASLLGGLGGSSDFGGAFGFTATGATGSTDAVISGLGSEGGTEGMSALMGLAAYAQGTPYVPNTQLAMLHQGEAVIPAAQNSPYAGSGGIGSVTNNFVLPGQTDMRTQSQIAGLVGGAIQTAIRRNG